jgi:glycosyltransferase involved in cell wall biosynthesis
VRFLGAREDMPELMNASDALLLSSVVEGLPMVLLEAAASGLPCVATNVGGVKECIVNEQTGFVVPAKDPAALAAAMSRLIEMPAGARQRIGEAARALALERFDIAAVTEQWERTYLELSECTDASRYC